MLCFKSHFYINWAIVFCLFACSAPVDAVFSYLLFLDSMQCFLTLVSLWVFRGARRQTGVSLGEMERPSVNRNQDNVTHRHNSIALGSGKEKDQTS